MKTTRRLALLTTIAALTASVPAASAATSSLSIKVPRCSNASTASVSVIAKPAATSVVYAVAAFLNGPPGQPGSTVVAQKIYVTVGAHMSTLPYGVSRTLTFRVPLGKKIYAIGGFGSSGGDASKTAISNGVKKCPKPKPKFTG